MFYVNKKALYRAVTIQKYIVTAQYNAFLTTNKIKNQRKSAQSASSVVDFKTQSHYHHPPATKHH
jgi:hypothetical protein